MFRSKSFNNINQPSVSSFLPHAKSASDIDKTLLDARTVITIKTVRVEEISNIAQRILNNSRGWKVDYSLDSEKNQWNDRYYDSYNMLSNIDDHIIACGSNENLSIFVAYFSGVPVGILVFTFNEQITSALPKVNLLVTHCGIRNCGILLMDHAVNTSLKLGMKGKLELYPLDGAIPAYLKMGFTVLADSPYLQLDPDKSNKWDCSNPNRYRYQGVKGNMMKTFFDWTLKVLQ
ncbi:GNAT family N-acetyltransferase [Xenorhabdus sp. PR6a]|uniref:GNAT family N-acetyltransferase n=1 Tax=Xenorhabdus sp. PR6a TaxID=3025877 RepID=UPI0023596480|nr:GNAT family N-acetyltransferase [Xenorhabdus sp. PR6a]MDC9581105.1 GNAT family N-acetyltransferase [Xenorhabdus sp. PR6a]